MPPNAEAANAGIALGAGFQIKFQQYDNFPLPTDGRGWDEITISGADDDHYSLELLRGESLSLATTVGGASGVALEILDDQGNVVAQPTQVSLMNGGFEAGDFTGWTTVTTGTPFRPWSVTGGGSGGGWREAATTFGPPAVALRRLGRGPDPARSEQR